MKRRLNPITAMIIVIALALTPVIVSCGSLHSHCGVEHEYYMDGDGGYPYHKPPKPKKHKKHKKHRKHHDHHDHDDYDD